MPRIAPVIITALTALTLTTGTAVAGGGVAVNVRVASGVSIGASWIIGPAQVMRVPDLGVVDIDVGPGRTRLYLNDRFIGVADDFDGFPDYLYLRPGSYELRCELGGYRTEVVEIDAKGQQYYQLDFRMKRIPNTEKESWWERAESPDPVQRVWEPVPAAQPKQASGERSAAGANPALRQDLEKAGEPHTRTVATGGSLRLAVEPRSASVYIDGEFVATGEELALMVGPLAVDAGEHVVEAVAPGFEPQRTKLVVETGTVEKVEITLRPTEGGQDPNEDLSSPQA